MKKGCLFTTETSFNEQMSAYVIVARIVIGHIFVHADELPGVLLDWL